MAIPEPQLEAWSHQGSITQSRDTYATIKRALESPNAHFTDRNFQVFLQGSYGKDTNVFAESDVDVVIRYDGAFFHDVTALPADQQSAFATSMPNGTYSYETFKGHVQTALKAAFGDSVKPGNKSIKVEAAGSRRNADVVVAFEYRRYSKFNGESDQSFDRGIAFFTQNGALIPNYPNQHSQNLTKKHQETRSNFKPLVRIFKNMRNNLVETRKLGRGIAPSYFIEGLLYNVPNEKFNGNRGDAVYNILNWIYQAPDKSQFLCVNEQYYLVYENSAVCWPIANSQDFTNKVILLWNDW